MARGRLISKSLGSSRRFHELLKLGGKLGEFCQVLFPLIVANTDDFGRMAGDAFTIKNLVLPTSRRPERDFESALDVLDQSGLLIRYLSDDTIYIQVSKFDDHQPNLQKRTKSKFPEIPTDSGITQKVLSNLTELKGTESKRTQNRADALVFEAFWKAYPRKESKEKARKEWTKRSPDQALLTVMLRALERQKLSPAWQSDRGRYIPHPDTWLRNARWTDEGTEVTDAAESYEWACPHDPACMARHACHIKSTIEANRKSA